jgi:hypothetical protein
MKRRINPAMPIFLLALALLAFFYSQLKQLTGGGWRFLITVVSYLVVARLIADTVGRLIRSDE